MVRANAFSSHSNNHRSTPIKGTVPTAKCNARRDRPMIPGASGTTPGFVIESRAEIGGRVLVSCVLWPLLNRFFLTADELEPALQFCSKVGVAGGDIHRLARFLPKPSV